VFADGLRNEVGLAFDKTGILWGVENSGDRLVRDDLGGDIHNGNPAEEMNRFDGAVGSHYGYPYCFGSYDLEGYEPLTQFVWPDFMDNGIHSDEWCRNVTNVRTNLVRISIRNCHTLLNFPSDFVGSPLESCSTSCLSGPYSPAWDRFLRWGRVPK